MTSLCLSPADESSEASAALVDIAMHRQPQRVAMPVSVTLAPRPLCELVSISSYQVSQPSVRRGAAVLGCSRAR